MTTSVDILFKELPAMSQASDRISRPDVAPAGSDYGRDRSDEVSNRNNDYRNEKSFSDHLENHDAPKERSVWPNERSVRNEQQTSTSDKPTETATDKPADPQNVEVSEKAKPTEAKNEPAPSSDVTDKTTHASDAPSSNVAHVENAPADIAPSFTTKDLLLAEKTPEKAILMSNENSALKNVKSENIVIPENALGTVKVTGDSNPENQSQNNDKNGNNVDKGLTIAAASNNENASINSPIFAPTNGENSSQSDIKSPTLDIKGQGQNTPQSDPQVALNSAFIKGATVDTDTGITTSSVKSENPLNAGADVDNKAQKVPANNASGVSEKVAEILRDNGIGKTVAAAPEKPVVEPIHEEIGVAVSAMAKAMQNEIASADLMEKPVPVPETVAVESTKVLPFAHIQSQNTAQNSKSSTKKSGNSVSAIKATSGASAQASANAAQNAMQNAASSSALLGAQKSDIQLDTGLLGQQFDQATGQSLAPNGQASLSTGSMLAAQDVNFQKALSSVTAAAKSDAPMNAKMVNEQITIAINKNVVKGLNNFSIRLNPAELGQVDIKLEFGADGKMQASMMVENEKTLAMLQRDQSSLEKALQDAGINLSNKNLSFSLMKQNQENNARKFAGMGNSSNDDAGIDELTELGSMQEIRMAYSNQALDISV